MRTNSESKDSFLVFEPSFPSRCSQSLLLLKLTSFSPGPTGLESLRGLIVLCEAGAGGSVPNIDQDAACSISVLLGFDIVDATLARWARASSWVTGKKPNAERPAPFLSLFGGLPLPFAVRIGGMAVV